MNQSLAIARAGCPVCHAGMIGEDGLFLKELLEKDGVDCRFLRVLDGGTGKAFIQVDASGQNCIVLSGGANRRNSREFCDQVLEAFERGDLLLLQNEINCVDYLIDRAYEKGMKIALNPSPMNDGILSCDLSKVSYFILNEEEGKCITGKEAAEEILEEMERRFPEAEIILTLGEKGSVYGHKGKRVSQGIYQVEAVDTTGAGDTFTGYVLANLAKGADMADCLKMGAKASAIAVTRNGAASAIPYAEEVEQWRE
jgi:ribokinase